MSFLIISNDRYVEENENVYSNSNELAILKDIFLEDEKLYIYSRKAKLSLQYKFLKKKLHFIYNIQDFLKIRKNIKKILMVSITPFNFFSYLLLKIFFFNKPFIIYLRSDGFEEYRIKYGILGYIIYNIFFKLISNEEKFILCSEILLRSKIKSKSVVVQPSDLTNIWFENYKIKKNISQYKKIKLLYIGRFRIEKGFYFLIDIIKKLKINFQITLVGNDNENFKKYSNELVNILPIVENRKHLIDIYDDHDIFILPSYTESYSKVLRESIARLVPVIIFNEIKFLSKNLKGVYVCERNISSFENMINHIVKNYSQIQKSMIGQKLDKKSDYLEKMQRELL